MNAVAGLGFRQQTSCQTLRQVLDEALRAAERGHGAISLRALATADDKCGHPAFAQLVAELALPVVAVPLAQLCAQDVQTSAHVPACYGAQSLAEAAALAAAGQDAALAAARHISADGSATAAIAVNLSERARSRVGRLDCLKGISLCRINIQNQTFQVRQNTWVEIQKSVYLSRAYP